MEITGHEKIFMIMILGTNYELWCTEKKQLQNRKVQFERKQTS